MHATINGIYIYAKTEGKLPTEKEVVAWFKEFLGNQRLNKDIRADVKRGEKAFRFSMRRRRGCSCPTDITERDFQDQGVVVGTAPLTGKIDRMTIEQKEIVVTDFKTGKSVPSWEPGDFYEKIKAWRCRDQIIFYKLLIENSREFGGGYAVHRGIIQFVEPSHGRIAELKLTIEPKETERLTADSSMRSTRKSKPSISPTSANIPKT